MLFSLSYFFGSYGVKKNLGNSLWANCQNYFDGWPVFFFKNFNSIKNILFCMNVETLRSVLEKVPEDYEVKYIDRSIGNSFEIDVDNKKLILK